MERPDRSPPDEPAEPSTGPSDEPSTDDSGSTGSERPEVRLFVAIPLPPGLRKRIVEECPGRGERGVRWVPEEQIHLTLRFIGEIERRRVDGIVQRLAPALADLRRFRAALQEAGAFPSLARPRVLWLGVEPVPDLMAAHAAVTSALERAGIEPEPRGFHPHITLGRVRSRGGPDPELGGFGDWDFRGTLVVRSIRLVRSDLGSGGARHTPLAELPLGRPPAPPPSSP